MERNMAMYANCCILENGVEKPIEQVEFDYLGRVAKIQIAGEWQDWYNSPEIYTKGIGQSMESIEISDDIDDLCRSVNSLYGFDDAGEWTDIYDFDENNIEHVKALLKLQSQRDYSMTAQFMQTDEERNAKLIKAYQIAFRDRG